jgi:hypothetical protein
VIFSIFTMFTFCWQIFVLFACSSGLGLVFRFLLPKELSLLHKVLLSAVGGFSLVVLIAQNLVYLGVPVQISAWLLLGVALAQVWWCRRKFVVWGRAFCSNGDVRALAVVILLTVTFHGIVPVRQGLGWYYGKGHFDQINYVLLAEFLKEEPYSTSQEEIGLRPWLVGTVGFHDPTGQLSSGAGLETIGLKKVRIGQSIVTAEIGVWSWTDGKGSYAATVVFFLTLLAICVYGFLRQTGIDRFLAGAGALLAAFLPVVTRLSLDGFLSQISVLFVFPLFGCLLRPHDLSARSFTLLFSLTLAYLISAYSEIAPIGLCTLFLGVMFVRQDKMRVKRLILMSAILLIALMNPYYLGNLIQFLGYQYNLAAGAPSLWDNVMPNVLTLRGWSEIIFGTISPAPFASFIDLCALLLGVLFLGGAILLPGSAKLLFGAILLPPFLLVLYLAIRTPFSYYPIAKITLTILPCVIGLVFVPVSRFAANNGDRAVGALTKVLCAIVVAAAAAGSACYYSEVLNNQGLVGIFREPRFLEVCRKLEEINKKRVLVFETHPLLSAWLCYHARHNEVYFDGRLLSDSPIPASLPFSKIPDLKNIDFVVTRDRILDLKAPSIPCLTSVDDTPGEDWGDGRIRYWLGPPARLRFLALRPMSANLNMWLAPAPKVATSPIDFFLTDVHGHVSRWELWSKKVQVLRMTLPKGLSYLELSVKAEENDPNTGPSFPTLAELDGLEISDVDLNPGG